VGDIMLGTSYPDSNCLPADNANNSFKHVVPHLTDADVTFGNLEGTLLDSGAPDIHKKKMATAYLFRMPGYYSDVIKKAGFNMLSIANNHITDFGEAGYNNTMKVLDTAGINFAGLQKRPSCIFVKNGIKYGFCAFAPNANTVSMLDLKNSAKLISSLKQQCDIVIVSFHGGAEGTTYEHVPFVNEKYKGENRGDVYAFAHNAIDAGADMVFGNGPHVCRGMEKYKDRIIAYSLGNFCTYKSVSVAGVCGYAPLLKVYTNKKGEFLRGHIIAFNQTHENGLLPDGKKRAITRIKQLTEADFPESGLTISEDGAIINTEKS
jgi:hypothetical protein